MRTLPFAAAALLLAGCATSQNTRPTPPPSGSVHQAQPVEGSAAGTAVQPGTATQPSTAPTPPPSATQSLAPTQTAPRAGATATVGGNTAQSSATVGAASPQSAPVAVGGAAPAASAQVGSQTSQPAATVGANSPESTRAQVGAATPSREHMGMMRPLCTSELPGTQVRAEDTSDGAALVFTTSPANLQTVRTRVKDMAQMHSSHAEMHARPRGVPPMQRMQGMGGGMGSDALMSAQAREEDTPDGARLVFTPKQKSDATQLRTDLRAHAQWLSSAQCAHGGMMHHAPPHGHVMPGAHPSPH